MRFANFLKRISLMPSRVVGAGTVAAQRTSKLNKRNIAIFSAVIFYATSFGGVVEAIESCETALQQCGPICWGGVGLDECARCLVERCSCEDDQQLVCDSNATFAQIAPDGVVEGVLCNCEGGVTGQQEAEAVGESAENGVTDQCISEAVTSDQKSAIYEPVELEVFLKNNFGTTENRQWAITLHENGGYSAALAYLRRELDKTPQDVELNLFAGRSYLGLVSHKMKKDDKPDTRELSELLDYSVFFLTRAQRLAQSPDEKNRASEALEDAQALLAEQKKQAEEKAKRFAKAIADTDRKAKTGWNKLREQKDLKLGKIVKDCETCPELVVVPPGAYVWSNNSDQDPCYVRAIERPFLVSRFEITFGQWDACAEDGGCNRYEPICPGDRCDDKIGRSERPVVNVNFDDVSAYISWLSAKTGKKYRLLTAGEWMHAARAGTVTTFWWGDEPGHDRMNCNGCGNLWNWTLAPVGRFEPNPFGLHDMISNVQEFILATDEEVWLSQDTHAWKKMAQPKPALIGGYALSAPDDMSGFADFSTVEPYERDERNEWHGFRIAREIE